MDIESEQRKGNKERLGDVLSGRLATLDMNSVEEVRDLRERDR